MVSRGTTLVELLVALVLLGVGLTAVGSSVAYARRAANAARLEERALAAAAAVVDSLAVEARPGPGQLDGAGYRLRWTVEGEGRLRLVVVLPALRDSVRRSFELRFFTAEPPVLPWPTAP